MKCENWEEGRFTVKGPDGHRRVFRRHWRCAQADFWMDVPIAFKMEFGTLAKATSSKEAYGSYDSAEMVHEVTGARVYACRIPRRRRPNSSGPS